nr:MAG TPA: hypothetical protein [Caudoviricetes sp.]
MSNLGIKISAQLPNSSRDTSPYFLRSNLKSNLAKFVNFDFKFYAPRPASLRR